MVKTIIRTSQVGNKYWIVLYTFLVLSEAIRIYRI